jgi:L-ascorbate metabolism protein UlaG (beta-lactamase superfamily)
MGPSDSLRALALLKPGRVVPIHYDTFDLIKQDPDKWANEVRAARLAEPIVMKPGDWLDV